MDVTEAHEPPLRSSGAASEEPLPEGSISASPPASYKYEAFISYCHTQQDEKIAREVQRAIEGFHLPGSITKTIGHSASRLGKCFRDVDELAASPSLPSAIHDALAQSGCLIVVCSPDAAASRWVRREVEAFAQLHGRDRIFAVLASGTSQESIPSALRPATDPLAHHDERSSTTASPLAADLRSERRRSGRQNELLRLIAAVAGCDYDELRRREAARKRKKAATRAAAATLAAAIVIALGAQTCSSRSDALANESKQLAALSADQLSRGERMQAIQTALDALPSSSAEKERPVVPEAMAALKEALEVDLDPTTIWRPGFVIDAADDICAFASDPASDWIAALDASGCLGVYSASTGHERHAFDLACLSEDPTSFDAEEWRVVAAGNQRLIAANRVGNGGLACIDATDGSLLWQREGLSVSSLSASSDGSLLVAFSVISDEGIAAELIDTESGSTVAQAQLANPAFLAAPEFLPSSLDEQAMRAYLGIAGALVAVDFTAGTIEASMVNDMKADSTMAISTAALVASSQTNDDLAPEGLLAEVNAVDTAGNMILWTSRSTYDYATVGGPFASTAIPGNPRIWCLLDIGEPAVAWSAGCTLHVDSLFDGSALETYEFSSNIVGVGRTSSNDHSDVLSMATADGVLDSRVPSLSASKHADSFRTTIPYRIDDAIMQWQQGERLLSIMHAVDEPKRLVIYCQDVRLEQEAHEYSLDELIELAHEALSD